MHRYIFILLLISFSNFCYASSPALPELSFDNAQVQVTEGDNATLQVVLSHPVPYPVRVTLSTRKGNAVSGQDFVSKSQRITFPAGSTSQSVTFNTNDDEIDEAEQFFWVYLRNPSNAEIMTERAKLTIVDNDDAPTITFDKYEYSIVEGTSNKPTEVKIRVRLSHRSEKIIRFTVHTAANTATAFEFEYVAERVLFDSKSVVFDYIVNVVADADLEGRQQFYLYMRNPSNSHLLLDDPDADRIRTKIKINDDDQLSPQPQIYAANSFTWIGTFGRRFTEIELDEIAKNTEFVVLAKFHALFDIDIHHDEAALLKQRNPSLKVLPYFNAKHWFLESKWGTTPHSECLVRDSNGDLEVKPTDRSDANYLDLRIPSCRQWMMDTVLDWMNTNNYDGIAYDSAGPIGDFGEGTYWQDLLGNQFEVDAWNAGLETLLSETKELLQQQGLIVIFNGIGESSFRDIDRDTFQLDYTDGALNESFAINPAGGLRASLVDDIELMQTASDKILLMKTNIYDDGDNQRTLRLGRFAYASFLMGWVPEQSYFKYGVDDFYTSAELEDFAIVRQLDIGLPVDFYTKTYELMSREFDNYFVFVNPTDSEVAVSHNGNVLLVPSMDALFISK